MVRYRGLYCLVLQNARLASGPGTISKRHTDARLPSLSIQPLARGRSGLERRLAAILAADVVGYTRLMGKGRD